MLVGVVDPFVDLSGSRLVAHLLLPPIDHDASSTIRSVMTLVRSPGRDGSEIGSQSPVAGGEDLGDVRAEEVAGSVPLEPVAHGFGDVDEEQQAIRVTGAAAQVLERADGGPVDRFEVVEIEDDRTAGWATRRPRSPGEGSLPRPACRTTRGGRSRSVDRRPRRSARAAYRAGPASLVPSVRTASERGLTRTEGWGSDGGSQVLGAAVLFER